MPPSIGVGERRRVSRVPPPRYDPASERVVVDLTNGCTFAFSARLAQGLGAATADELAAVEVLPGGYGLYWRRWTSTCRCGALGAGSLHGAPGKHSTSGEARAARERRGGTAHPQTGERLKAEDGAGKEVGATLVAG